MEELSILWNRFKQGDEQAFDSLFKQMHPLLCPFAQRILNNRADAEDTVQEVFINLWKNKDKIHIAGSSKAYLFQMVHNSCYNKILHFRTLKYQTNKLTETEIWNRIHESYQIQDSFIQLLEAKETEEVIKKAVEDLPDKCREIFILNRFQGYSYEEIATKLKISQNTVRVQIFRALEQLRNSLKKFLSIILVFL